MPAPWPSILISLSLLVLGFVVALALWLRRGPSVYEAPRLFRMQREHLEADFLRAAAASGKPRGLRWKACDWDDEVLFARDRRSGHLTAWVGVTIEFEAIEGSDMEGLPAVGNLRNASGFFLFDRGRWWATGKAYFNVNPDEAIERFKEQFERVEPTTGPEPPIGSA